MAQRRLPVVDEMRCVSSGDCVRVCPTRCLEMRDALGDGLPALARPYDCVSCELCVAVCPVQAIQMEQRWEANK